MIKKERESKMHYKQRRRAPKGHFVVYVGEDEELRRFVVPLSVLRTTPFRNLLDKAAEEFGYENQNAIVLPCDESTFLEILELAAVSSTSECHFSVH